MNVVHSESLQICKATDRYIYAFRFCSLYRRLLLNRKKRGGKKRKKERKTYESITSQGNLTIYQCYGTMERENNSAYAEKKLKFLKNWHRVRPFLRQTLNDADSGQWLCNMHPLARCFSFPRVVKRHTATKRHPRCFVDLNPVALLSHVEHRLVSIFLDSFSFKVFIFLGRNSRE